MALQLEQVKQELGEVVQNRPTAIMDALYADIEMDGMFREITKVNGKYPSTHKIMQNVIQRFRPQWDGMGDLIFHAKNLEAYNLKFNVGIVPDELMGTWLSELRREDKKIEDYPLSQMILEDIAKKVTEDVNWLMQAGEFEDVYGVFEKSMDGLAKKLQNAINSATHPAYLIPLTTLDENNAYDQIKAFEKAIPKKMVRHIKRIVTSMQNLEMYIEAKYALTGNNPDYDKKQRAATFMNGWEVVGLSSLPNDALFATVEDNLVKLIDIFDKPMLKDIQVQDYTLKIFGEGTLGIDFAVNQYVFAANFEDDSAGFAQLDDAPAEAAMKKLYFLGT